MGNSIIVDQATNPTSYAIVDDKGIKLGHYETMKEAEQALAASISPPVPHDTLMQSDMHDTGVQRAKPKRAKPKGKQMPRGIPKKKAAKKRSVRSRSAVKTVAKKTAKRRRRRA